MTQLAVSGASCSAVKHEFPEARPAVLKLIDLEKDADVLLFGYTHREYHNQPSSAKIFADEVLPALKATGFRDLVLEIFPVSNNNSLLEIEIRRFNRTGKIGSEMRRFLPFLDSKNFIHLLKTAHKLGIKVHAGGVDYGNVLRTLFVSRDRSVLDQIVSETVRNSKKAIAGLLRCRKKVASFGGASHNDLSPRSREEHQSFADDLAAQFPGKIVEVDLAVPELSKEDGNFETLPLDSSCSWNSFIPQKGINLVVSLPFQHVYLLFWPDKQD